MKTQKWLKMVPSFLGVCAFTGIQHCDVAVFKPCVFFSHPSPWVLLNGVFKYLHSGEQYWKDDHFHRIHADSRINRRKKSAFSNRNGYVGLGTWGHSFLRVQRTHCLPQSLTEGDHDFQDKVRLLRKHKQSSARSYGHGVACERVFQWWQAKRAARERASKRRRKMIILAIFLASSSYGKYGKPKKSLEDVEKKKKKVNQKKIKKKKKKKKKNSLTEKHRSWNFDSLSFPATLTLLSFRVWLSLLQMEGLFAGYG